MSAAVSVRRPPLPVMPKIGKARPVVLDRQIRSIVEGLENTITLRCLGKKTWLASRPLGIGSLGFHGRGNGPVEALADLHRVVEKDRVACEADEPESICAKLEESLAAVGGAP